MRIFNTLLAILLLPATASFVSAAENRAESDDNADAAVSPEQQALYDHF